MNSVVSVAPQQIKGIVLNAVASGESHRRYTLFSAREGLQSALFRIRAKKGAPPAPDFFDLVELSLRQPSSITSIPFAKEGECLILRKRTELGADHNRFLAASGISRLFLDNAIHLLEPASMFTLLENSLDALIAGGNSTIIRFKTLFVFARNEGHPVKQAWMTELDSSMRKSAGIILGKTVAELGDGPEHSSQLLQSLSRWLNSETEFIC